MKLLIEEKDETQSYRPISAQQFLQSVKADNQKVVIRVPNMCGGETRITIYESAIPLGNEANLAALRRNVKASKKSRKAKL